MNDTQKQKLDELISNLQRNYFELIDYFHSDEDIKHYESFLEYKIRNTKQDD